MRTPRPFLLLRDTDKRAIATAVEDLLNAWARKWWVGGESVVVHEVFPVDERSALLAQADYCVGVQGGGDRICMLFLPSSTARAIASGLLREAVPLTGQALTPLEKELLRAALEDGARHAVRSTRHEGSVEEVQDMRCALAELATPGSGSVTCQVSCGDAELTVVLGGALLQEHWRRDQVDETANRIVAVADALRLCDQAHVRAEVSLGEAEITIGALSSVRVGDVIALDARVDEPVALRLNGRENILLGYLGTHAGALAVQVVQPNS